MENPQLLVFVFIIKLGAFVSKFIEERKNHLVETLAC